ncbi:MAG: DMT family transporter [Bacillaceae bacterium]
MTAKRFFTNPIGMVVTACFVTFLWGSALPFIKLSYRLLDIRPDEIGEQLLFAGYRFLLAGLFVLLYALIAKKQVRFQFQTTKTIIKIGLLQTFLQYVFFYIGLSLSTGVQGSIIAGTASFFQIMFAHFMYQDDRIDMRKIVGLIVGFAGVIFVNVSKGDLSLHFGIGEFLVLCSAAAGALGNLFARNSAKKLEIGYMTGYQMLFGAILLTAIGSTQVGIAPFQFELVSFFMLIYLALLSAVGFVLWNNIMKYNKVGKVSMFMFLVPVFGTFLSSFILGEALSIFVVIGLTCVVLGILIVNRTGSEKGKKIIKVS